MLTRGRAMIARTSAGAHERGGGLAPVLAGKLDQAHGVEGVGVAGLQFQRPPHPRLRFVQAALAAQQHTEMRVRVAGLSGERRSEASNWARASSPRSISSSTMPRWKRAQGCSGFRSTAFSRAARAAGRFLARCSRPPRAYQASKLSGSSRVSSAKWGMASASRPRARRRGPGAPGPPCWPARVPGNGGEVPVPARVVPRPPG
jgi:hypothetical protein